MIERTQRQRATVVALLYFVHQIGELDRHCSVDDVHDLDLHRVGQCRDDVGKIYSPHLQLALLRRLSYQQIKVTHDRCHQKSEACMSSE